MLSSLKQISKRLPYPVFLRLFQGYHFTRDLLLAETARRRGGIPLLDELDLHQFRASDVLFILGSGPSINRISSERWEGIARHDTVGFNFWLYHWFVPRMYFFESMAYGDQSPAMIESFLDISSRRGDAYKDTIKVVHELNRTGRQIVFDLAKEWTQNLYAVRALPVPASNREQLAYALKYLISKGAFGAARRVRYLFKYGSSLTSLIALGVRMGYRKIVMCGVDLTSQDYFYQDPTLYPETQSLEFVPRDRPHIIYRKAPWLLPIDSVVHELKLHVLDPGRIEIFVENRCSALWPTIPEAPTNLFTAHQEDPSVAVPGSRRVPISIDVGLR